MSVYVQNLHILPAEMYKVSNDLSMSWKTYFQWTKYVALVSRPLLKPYGPYDWKCLRPWTENMGFDEKKKKKKNKEIGELQILNKWLKNKNLRITLAKFVKFMCKTKLEKAVVWL